MVRPEKIRLLPEGAPSTGNAVRGKVKDLGYFGGVTAYRVALDSGKLVHITVTNMARALALKADWDERVTLSWDPASAVLLTE